MDGPNELSLSEIREYMLQNGCKVTNHALVKHFKRFLTNPDTQNEARKQFKTYVNILATIKNENNQKYLILRKKYINECPSEDMAESSNPGTPMSPGGASLNFEPEGSPLRQPPPYKPPPQVSPAHQVKIPVLESETKENYKDCINEFQAAVSKIDPSRFKSSESVEEGSVSSQSGSSQTPPSVPPRKRQSAERSMSRESSIDENKENYEKNDASESVDSDKRKDSENSISVKEATRKFNRLASEEEAKVLSPSPKKKPEKEKTIAEDKPPAEVTLAHPKAKEWIVSAAKANYQDLAKLASDYPELVKLQDPTTGYTALHWAAKHGNEDVVKLIAGTYKADIHARTNGGYTPLHLAMQFGKENIFDLLVNVYKANRDITDWSGNKPLDYSRQRTSVSASTYSSEYEPLRPKTYQNLEHISGQYRSSVAAGGSLSLPRRKRENRKTVFGVNNNLITTTLDNTLRVQSMLFTGDIMSPQEKCEMFLASERGQHPPSAENSLSTNTTGTGSISSDTGIGSSEQFIPASRFTTTPRSKRNESFLAKKKLKTSASRKNSTEESHC